MPLGILDLHFPDSLACFETPIFEDKPCSMTHLPSKITPQNTKANSSVSSPKRIKVEDQISVADNSLLSRYQNRSNGSKVIQPQTFELFDIPELIERPLSEASVVQVMI